MAKLKIRPRTGSLPLQKQYAHPPSKLEGPLPPWHEADPDAFRADFLRREKLSQSSALQQARAKVEELSGTFRTDAFNDWVRRCVVDSQTPDEWTQARILYESYIAYVQGYGDNRSQRAQSVLTLATETQWGRMMATLFIKKRRTSGWFYPLRRKRGA